MFSLSWEGRWGKSREGNEARLNAIRLGEACLVSYQPPALRERAPDVNQVETTKSASLEEEFRRGSFLLRGPVHLEPQGSTDASAWRCQQMSAAASGC